MLSYQPLLVAFRYCLLGSFNKIRIIIEMSFLDKFKGKTTILTKQEVGGILGRVNSNPNTPPVKNVNSSFAVALPSKDKIPRKLKKIPGQPEEKDSPVLSRIQKINPFSVSNPFYLDESERQRDQKLKREKEMRQRLQKQRKRREEIEQRMQEFQKSNKEQFQKKEWIKLGGLGPNIGSEQWSKKKEMQSKMMFAEEIKQINFGRIKCTPFMSYSHMTKQAKKDARTKAIQYSRSVPRPNVMSGERSIYQLPRSESRDQIDQMELLDRNHEKHMLMVKQYSKGTRNDKQSYK